MDRFIRGFLVGVGAGIIKEMLSFINYYLGIADKTYAHLMGVMLLGRAVNTNLEVLLGFIVEIGYTGVLGIIFTYFAYRTKNKATLWVKGGIFGLLVYLFAYSLGTMYDVPVLKRIDAITASLNLVTSVLYGIMLGSGIYHWGLLKNEFPPKQLMMAARKPRIKHK